MPDLSRHTRMMFVAALLAASTLGACGGDDEPSDQAAAPAATTAPTTETEPEQTTPAPSDTETTPTPTSTTTTPRKVIPLDAPPKSLSAGGLKVEIEIESVIDPVLADVDEPQDGGRFVGVFLKSRASGKYEPSKVAAVASLTTSDGASYPVRVISGGECEGAFFPAAFVLKTKQARTGCVGFDIPKKVEPKEIVLGVRSTVSSAQDTATWKLPKAK